METSSLEFTIDDLFEPDGHTSANPAANHILDSPRATSQDDSIQQTPITLTAPHKRKFFQIPEGHFLHQHRSIAPEGSSESAIGITDIQNGVGMYVEQRNGISFAWHIKPPTIPSLYPGFTILNPPEHQEASKRDLKRISKLISEYLLNILGRCDQTADESKLVIVTPSPTAVNIAVIEGIFCWAGLAMREDGRHWRASPEVRPSADGFIVVRPDEVQWGLNVYENDAGRGSLKWMTSWEAVEAGVEDERSEIRGSVGDWREQCRRCVVM